ncbi:sulfurtransferase complex subunit TusB [Vreelandella aquamarina]|uniref:sulfurtransferase complex subunit TusB n=1 Tax=Vreelandella aquamarina TaxID=77097 RepID=UPI00384F2187
MLHILNKPPHSEAAQQMLSTLAAGDSVLLIEDAVQAALYPDWHGWNTTGAEVFLLEEDAATRGLLSIAAENNASLVDMEGFVALTEQNEKIISWY